MTDDTKPPLPQAFEEMLTHFLDTSARLSESILSHAVLLEPERFTDVAEGVQSGLLALQIMARGGLMQLGVVEVTTGEIHAIFEYGAPALEAPMGVAN